MVGLGALTDPVVQSDARSTQVLVSVHHFCGKLQHAFGPVAPVLLVKLSTQDLLMATVAGYPTLQSASVPHAVPSTALAPVAGGRVELPPVAGGGTDPFPPVAGGALPFGVPIHT